jgi:hypothetical protein
LSAAQGLLPPALVVLAVLDGDMLPVDEFGWAHALTPSAEMASDNAIAGLRATDRRILRSARYGNAMTESL